MLHLEDVSFAYGEDKILENVNLSVKSGEIVTLIGASGAGKSTIFRIITGLLPCKQGLVTVASQKGPICCRSIAYMMQEDLLLPWRTVIDNMVLPGELGPNSGPTPQLHQEAHQILAEMGLSKCANQYPHELSGGMHQRVSLARSILMKRPLLLLDEPFSSLDVCLRESMHHQLRQIRDQYGTAMLLITHDFRDAISLSDRILLLKNKSISQEWIVPDDLSPEDEGRLLMSMRSAMQ